jgi:hypothetical protein
MSDIIAFLVGMIMFLVIPTLLIILIVRAIKKKTVKKVAITLAICAGSIVPLSILGTFTDPATWCDHEYEITQEIAPTCSEKGEIHRHCPLCEDDDIEYVDTTPHQWDTDRVVEATCTSEGYILKRCKVCSSELKTDNGKALGHAMTEVSRTDPTRDLEGKILRKCDRCEHEEIEIIDKLPPLTYIEGVGYDEIYKAYKANKLCAEDVYKNNRYRITAEVNGMDTGGLFNVTGGATLTMLVKIDNTYVFFLAEFEKDQEEMLKTINVGDTITFEGECVSDEYWIECEIIVE